MFGGDTAPLTQALVRLGYGMGTVTAEQLYEGRLDKMPLAEAGERWLCVPLADRAEVGVLGRALTAEAIKLPDPHGAQLLLLANNNILYQREGDEAVLLVFKSIPELSDERRH